MCVVLVKKSHCMFVLLHMIRRWSREEGSEIPTIQDRRHLRRDPLPKTPSSVYVSRQERAVCAWILFDNEECFEDQTNSTVFCNRHHQRIFRVNNAHSLPFHAFLTFSGRPSTDLNVLGPFHVTKHLDCRLSWRAHAGSYSSRHGYLNRYTYDLRQISD